jgi:hypothetical protein
MPDRFRTTALIRPRHLRRAFAASPSTDVHADGSYDIPRAVLAAAGFDCGIDWSDYDFTTD